MLRSLLKQKLACLDSDQSVFPAPLEATGMIRRRRRWRILSQKRSPVLRASARPRLIRLHARLRKGRAAPDSGNGSSRLRTTAPRPSRRTLSAGRETWPSVHPTAHTGTVLTQTAANAYPMRRRIQKSRRPPPQVRMNEAPRVGEPAPTQ